MRAPLPRFLVLLPSVTAFPQASFSKICRFRLHAKPLSFWVMSWFLTAAIVLTVIGTFFRGAGWAWVWPWGAA